MSNPSGGRQPHYDAETLERMRRLWEGAPELTAAQIGERFGTSKDAVIGQARRRGWKRRPAGAGRSQSLPTSTTLTRLDAIHARMDALLSAPRAAALDRQGLLVDARREE